jgi:hypothetical protein
VEIKSGKNTMEIFIENKWFEMKEGMRGHLACKRDEVARPAGGTAPPRSVWALVANSASTLT